jgi:hypothetical protein
MRLGTMGKQIPEDRKQDGVSWNHWKKASDFFAYDW